jgi:phage terminase large subunit
VIFKGKFSIEAFDTPDDAEFFYGADWGFGPDPTTLVRCFIQDRNLFIDHESYAFGLDLDKIAATWRGAVPACDKWKIYADNSQPQTIAHVRNFGLNIEGAEKWAGSVEDGIAYMRGFERIVIHERCYYTGTEFRLYSYKTDKISGDVQPIVQDKNNHCMDALRYALQKRIRCKDIGVWEKLGARA